MKKKTFTLSANPICSFSAVILRGGRMTKWKGRAASMSPHIGALSSGISLPAFAVSMALGGGLMLAPAALAQTTLSGAQTTTVVLTDTPLVVVTDNTFSVVTVSGSALELNGTNGLSFTDAFSSTITGGGGYGIKARNFGTGALSVTATGAVTGTNGHGINARNSTSSSSVVGTSLTISAAEVSGGSDGIRAENTGTGALSVTATGAVTGNYEGINAKNKSAGTDLTISAAAVSGGDYGIRA